MAGEGFKAHDLRHGGRLSDQVGLGPTGFARQVREVGAASRRPAPAEGERGPGGSPSAEGSFVGEPPSAAPAPPRGPVGRPRVHAGEPWEAEGVSRRTWERRRRKKEGEG
jgi:hypothetical protein